MESSGSGNGNGDHAIPFHGCENMKVTNNPSMYRSGPPLTAIDRFLWGQQQSHFPQSQHQHQQQQHNNDVAKNISHASTVFDEEFYKFACSGGSNTYRFMWPNYTTQEASIVDQLLANEEALNWAHPIPTLCQNEDVQVLGNKNLKVVGRRPKKGSSVSLIKGQWTPEEDRLSKEKEFSFFFFSFCTILVYLVILV